MQNIVHINFEILRGKISLKTNKFHLNRYSSNISIWANKPCGSSLNSRKSDNIENKVINKRFLLKVMVQLVDLKWKRPSVVEYPKVWRTFSVKSEQTDKSVEYRIQDLPESRFDDAIEFMAQIFCRIEPLCKAYGK